MNQEKLWRTNFHTSLLKFCEPYLREYFGINYGYFQKEIEQVENYWAIKVEIGESPTLAVIESDAEIPFYHHIFTDDFRLLFEDILDKDDESDEALIYILWFVAYIVMEKNDDNIPDEYYDDFVAQIEYDMVREDLLNLYIFEKSQNAKTPGGQKIILKHQKGNLPISNYDNWFTKKMLKEYLDKYLTDITTIEQAEQELRKYKNPVGRKPKDPRLLIIMYGIYRLFNDTKDMTSPKSDVLCDFIISFLGYIGMDEDCNLDKQWVRAQIDYISKKDSPPLFPSMEVMVRASIEELKNSGKRLY